MATRSKKTQPEVVEDVVEDKPAEVLNEPPAKNKEEVAEAAAEVVAEAPPVETKVADLSIAEAEDAAPVKTDGTTSEDITPAEGIAPKSEYEFLEELPNKQQAAPVMKTAAGQKETRITAAIDGDQEEPELVDHDKAFDKETAIGAPPIEGRPEPEPAPAKVDQPEIIGVSKTTDTRVTAAISESGETQPKSVEYEDTFAEGTSKTLEPNPGRKGGEGHRYDKDAYNAASSEEEPVKRGKAKKTDNPKLARLKKYGA